MDFLAKRSTGIRNSSSVLVLHQSTVGFQEINVGVFDDFSNKSPHKGNGKLDKVLTAKLRENNEEAWIMNAVALLKHELSLKKKKK